MTTRTTAALALALIGLASTPARAGPWVPFEWFGATLGSKVFDRAAILVPIEVDGQRCLLQLDTGAGYRIHARSGRAEDAARYETALDRLLLEGVPSRAGEHETRSDDDGRCGLVGDVGSGYFVKGALQLDLKGGRLRTLSSTDPRPVSTDAGGPMDIVAPSGSDWPLPVIDVAIEGIGRRRALLDTGAAAFGLVFLDPGDWQAALELTGATAEAFAAQREDGDARCQVAADPVRVRLGGAQAHDLTPARCLSSFVPPAGLSVVMGLQGVGGDVLTLDYAGRRWFATTARPVEPCCGRWSVDGEGRVENR